MAASLLRNHSEHEFSGTIDVPEYNSQMIRCAAFLAWSLAFTTLAQEQIPLWPNGAPGFEDRRKEPEVAKDYWVKNIHNPSITVFLPPKEKATGAAAVICPGGGHRELVFNAEGAEPARHLNSLGIAAFVLKYRLGREEGSPYSIQKHAKEDGERAMRLVRSRAHEWNLSPDRLGIIGFSAGGEVAAMVAYSSAEGNQNASDPVEKLSSRPDFVVMIYPGPLGIPASIPTNAPPAFLLVANDDRGHSDVVVGLTEKYRQAKVPVEAHVYARGGHGFNMGNRSRLSSIKSWPQRLDDWLADSGFLETAH
jgi:acetyl esterase/lipase